MSNPGHILLRIKDVNYNWFTSTYNIEIMITYISYLAKNFSNIMVDIPCRVLCRNVASGGGLTWTKIHCTDCILYELY